MKCKEQSVWLQQIVYFLILQFFKGHNKSITQQCNVKSFALVHSLPREGNKAFSSLNQNKYLVNIPQTYPHSIIITRGSPSLETKFSGKF